MRIVIVGNENGRASALDEALGDFGLDWDVSWVADAAQVLAPAGGDSPDVVVSALDSGGGHLLAGVREHHPQAARMLLLDQGQDADAFRSMSLAHRLLRQPLDAGELIEAVESVIELRELLDSPALTDAVGRIETLPPPPKLYLDLTQLLHDPDTSSAEVAELLSQDPALAAKMLRLCNSAYFAAGRVVTDIRAAVTRLGLQNTQRLVLAAEAFGMPSDVEGVDREAMQERALMTSRLAGRILGGSSAELAATAGLLAEVGKLLPGMRHTAADGTEFNPEGPHYAEAGAYLLGLWGLPMPIVEAVAHHQQPARMRIGGFWVAGAVHVASALVTGTPLDENYLRSVGVLDKLPRWREMAEQFADAA